ncbi:MAG: diacylglycerol kinase family protein [Spirosomataceae bacterium]
MIDFNKFGRSVGFAVRGLRWLWQENNARIHALAGVAVVIVGISLGLSASEWLWIGLAIALVFIAELVNTSLERLTDLVSPHHHPLAGQAKDLAAAAVLVAALFAIVVGMVIVVPHVLAIFLEKL